MGQYHTIYNKTKKESFSIGGAKLLEKSFSPLNSTALMVLLCNSNGRGGGDLYVEHEYTKSYKPKPLEDEKLKINNALEQVQGRWAGDEIVIQGDYAEETDPGYMTKDEWMIVTDITEIVMLALCADPDLAQMVLKEQELVKSIRGMR